MAVIYLIRHGQASFLSSNYDQLSDLGIEQSRMLGNAFRNRKIQPTMVACGSLIRQQDTAKHFLNTMGSKEDFIVSVGWDEFDHMEVLNQHRPDLTTKEAMENFLSGQEDPKMILQDMLNSSILEWIAGKHDYSLTWMDFKERVWDSLQETIDKLNSGDKVLIFTSGGPISVVLLRLLELKDVQFTDLLPIMVNSSVTKLLIGKRGLNLSTYNDHSHLEHKPEWITYR